MLRVAQCFEVPFLSTHCHAWFVVSRPIMPSSGRNKDNLLHDEYVTLTISKVLPFEET